MANYSGAKSVHSKTLVANTADTVTLTADFGEVRVVNLDGAASIYFTVDGAAATVAGDGTLVLPAALASRVERAKVDRANTVVSLISSGTPKYSVEGV